MQILKNMIDDWNHRWQLRYFVRYLAVVNFHSIDCNNLKMVSYYAEIPLEDVIFIHDNFEKILDKYKDRKELDYFKYQ